MLRLAAFVCVLGVFCIIALIESHTDNRPVNQTFAMVDAGFRQGRPGMVVVEIGIFTLRLVCGWLTQSPYSPEYLSSSVDFPDSIINRFRDSMTSQPHQHVSFFFFFSGHVFLLALFRTYFKRIGRHWESFACDIFNLLQIIRLLGTRGHYTIDLIGGAFIGNYMYSFVPDVDRYLASFMYVKYLMKREKNKVN